VGITYNIVTFFVQLWKNVIEWEAAAYVLDYWSDAAYHKWGKIWGR
jgi:hypothetical protein